MKKGFLLSSFIIAISLLCCSALISANVGTTPGIAPKKAPAVELPTNLCHGACCLPDGTCERLTPDECANAGGVFMGEDVPCDSVDCSLTCCEKWVEIGDNFCLSFTEEDRTCDVLIRHVCWCCPMQGQPYFIPSPGCDYGIDGCNSDCESSDRQLFWKEAIFVPSDSCDEYGGHWTTTFYIEAPEPNDPGACYCVMFESQLPVELTTEPNVVAGSGQLTLNFTVADERDVTAYEIMRDRMKIAELELGNGTYTFCDKNLINGRRYEYSIVALELGARRVLSYDGQSVWAGIPAGESRIVTEYALHQCYPNPFNPTTTIAFDIVENGFVSLKVYNLMGQEIAQLVNRTMDVGRYDVTFDGSHLPSGVYVYRLDVNGYSSTKKMMLMK